MQVSIYWLGLEGDDVRFNEPHATTDKPLLSFELNDGWSVEPGWYLECEYGYDGVRTNELYLINNTEKVPWNYRASSVLFWILHCNNNGEQMPPFVKNYSGIIPPRSQCGCGGFRSPISGPERCGL